MANSKAIELIKLGIHPVRLGTYGDGLKIPAKGTDGWEAANYTLDDVARWPANANIGARMGWRRDGLFMLAFDFDHDAHKIFPKWLAAAGDILYRPFIVQTGKGYHVLVKMKDKPEYDNLLAAEFVDDGNKRRTRTLIEIRGEGQYVVAWGCKYPSGKTYKIVAGSPDKIPTLTPNQLEELLHQAKNFNRRPEQKPREKGPQRQYKGVGSLQGVNDCLDYAEKYIATRDGIVQEHDGQYRVTGNGGLLITPDRQSWYCHIDGQGGGLLGLIAWHQNVHFSVAQKMLRPAASVAAGNSVPTQRPPRPQQQPTATATVDIAAYANKQLATSDLAADLFQDPGVSMVMPMRDYFKGKYPPPMHEEHTCNNHLESQYFEDGRTVYKRFTEKLWRARKKDDHTLEACPACQQDYAWRAAKQLEYEVAAYDADDMPFRYQILKPAQANKMLKAARAWRDQGFDLRYWKRPMKGGRVALIHNVKDLDTFGIKGTNAFDRKAHDLPENRSELMTLFKGWIKDANTSKTSHTRGWGGEISGTRGESREDGDEEMPQVPVVALWTNYQEAKHAVTDYLKVSDLPDDLHIVDFVDILDRYRVNYHVGKGRDRLQELRRARSVHRDTDRRSIAPMYDTCHGGEKHPPPRVGPPRNGHMAGVGDVANA